MELKRVIERLEKYQEWRRDPNVPPKVEMQSPIEIGAASNIVDMATIRANEFKKEAVK